MIKKHAIIYRKIKGGNNIITIYNWCVKHNKIKKLNDCWSSKNKISPKQIYFYTKEKYYFKCEKNHEWLYVPSGYFYGQKCPYCIKRLASKEYNLEVVNSKLAKEFNSEKNGISPDKLLPHIPKKYWWRCSKGHEWKATINSRNSKKGHNCPYCAHQLPTEEYNLKVICPETVKQWDYKKINIYFQKVYYLILLLKFGGYVTRDIVIDLVQMLE